MEQKSKKQQSNVGSSQKMESVQFLEFNAEPKTIFIGGGKTLGQVLREIGVGYDASIRVDREAVDESHVLQHGQTITKVEAVEGGLQVPAVS